METAFAANSPAGRLRPGRWLLSSLLVGSLHNQALDDVVRAIDVLQRAMTQAVRENVVLFLGEVAMRFIEEFEGAMIAASATEVRVNGGMIVQILAVVNGGALDFGDGLVDLDDGVFFFTVHAAGVSLACEMSPRVAKVGESVEVGGMSPWLISKAERGKQCQAECDCGAMSCDLHDLLE